MKNVSYKTVNDNNLVLLTTNAADLRSKTKSLKNLIDHFKASVFSVQETHFPKKGRFTKENFIIFEANRTMKGGGSMLGVHVSLQPVLISEYSCTFELIVVELKAGNKRIQILTGYGPQEPWDLETKMPFFTAVEEEIAKSMNEGKSVVLMGDLNSKLGNEYIENDPKEQTENGTILAGIMDRHALIVLNGLAEKCLGLITRKRHTENGGIEESVIDFVIVSPDLVQYVESVMIDDKRQFTLTKLIQTKKGIKKTESDHNPIVTKMNLKWDSTIKNKPNEMFNFKNKECQKHFEYETDNTNELSQIIYRDKPTDLVLRQLMKRIEGFSHKCFKKIKIKDKVDLVLEELYNQRAKLRTKEDNESKEKLKEIEKEMADKYSEDMYNRIKKEVKGMNSEEGGWNPGHLWKLKQKISPRPTDPLTAMMNEEGVLITEPEEIEKLALQHYQKLFENLPIDEDLKEMQILKEKVCKMRLKICSETKTDPWTNEDIEYVLKQLKNDKSRDPLGYANELFKGGVAGKDLKLAILKIMNRIKCEQKIPKVMQLCNITSLYKHKGPRNQFNSYRGIFRVTVLRNILDRLLYNDLYQTIDSNLSDCNVGNRKQRNIRDNLFVLNAVLNATNAEKEEIDIGVYDVKKCFDTMWADEAWNDTFELAEQNDKLSLVYLANLNARIAVKNSNGITKRVHIQDTIMQGTVWAGLMCTSTMDKLGKYVYANPELAYKFRHTVVVPPLEMVDNILTISECGNTSCTMNTVVNTFMSDKKLQLNSEKCSQIHIGKARAACPNLKVQNKLMKRADKEKYLGDVVHKSGKPHANVVARISKGYGIAANIIALLTDIPLGNRRVQIGLELRQAWFVNGILFNSEAWPKLIKKDIEDLEKIDHYILRKITGAQAKVQIEMLYLETASLPLSYIISSRRAIYLQTILKRSDQELTRKIYNAMKNDPLPNDWSELAWKDLNDMQINMTENEIARMEVSDFRNLIKEKIRNWAFVNLKNMQVQHVKVKDILYSNPEKPQLYLTCAEMSNEEVALLFNLRCRSVKGIKDNFHNMYGNHVNCDLCQTKIDNQEHILKCHILKRHVETNASVRYKHIFGDIIQQKEVISCYSTLLAAREELLEVTGLPGHIVPD